MIHTLAALLPNLSGQSFIAVTRYDPDHPENIGVVAAMKPKPGFDRLQTPFSKRSRASWPELQQGKTGHGSVAGIDYESIQGPGGSDKICVARVDGWIVTTWGEASLRDWIERFQKKSTTPSLG